MSFKEPEFEITHICNKYCDNCSHRIKTSNFTSISIKEMKRILSYFKRSYVKDVQRILIIGGEPLCHPQWQEIFMLIKNKFPKAKIVISTNGRLMDSVPNEFFDHFKFRISEYPGWNDDIVNRYEGKKNIGISHWGYGWWPLVDPKLSLKKAKEVEKSCFHQVRIVGTKLYRCCLAEGVEREFKTKKVHVEMSPRWQNEWRRLPVWFACQRCFKSNLILGKWTKPRNKIVKHNRVSRKSN